MDLDGLIPFIIFLGIIVFNILKGLAKKKKQEKQEGTQPQKPARKKAFGLSKLVGAIKAEIELAGLEQKKKERKAEAITWEAESGDAGVDRAEDAVFEEGSAVDEVFEEDSPGTNLEEILDEETGSFGQPSEINEELPESEFVPAVKKKYAPMIYDIKKRKQRRVPRLSVSKMREAIILSEIVAKPVGLRDEPF
ncbi:MAG: hypothetical protein K8R67_12585 [Desulfobacteraceae bacterium]|nr:hypothetical protein [Desulfobacteraceae bacterium]